MFSSPLSRLSVLTLSLLVLAGVAVRAAEPGTLERVSVATDESEGFLPSGGPPALSGDGRYVAFVTQSPFFGADFNNFADIYVRDRLAGSTQMVSMGNPATPTGQRLIPNQPSHTPSISADGRYVSFVSGATNIVAGDTNNVSDVFVRDRLGNAIRVSVSSAGAQANDDSGGAQISGDGRFVVYESLADNLVAGDTNDLQDIFLTQIEPNPLGGGLQVVRTIRVSTDVFGEEADGDCSEPSVSYDGRYVAFQSDASNLDPEDFNDAIDIFVKDTITGDIVRVSVDSDGFEGDADSVHPTISADGRFVVFASDSDLLDPDDTNGVRDIFVHDRDYDENGIFDEIDGINTVRISISEFGDEGDDDSGLETFVGADARPTISADGRFIAFVSNASNLGSDFDDNFVSDVFLHDRDADEDGFFDDPDGITTERISVSEDGEEVDEPSLYSVISLDGSAVAFVSQSSDLVFDDENGVSDVFVWTGFTPGSLNEPPDVIIANEEQFVMEGQSVLLDASGTTDPDGDPLTFFWEQVGGETTVVLDNPTSPTPTFIAPLVSNFDILEFEVTVSDGINEPEIGFATVTVGLATPANISGFVRDASGNAVTGAQIRVVRSDGEEATTQFADSGGFYEVSDVRVGSNTVFVSANGFETVTRDITVTPGEIITLNITLDTFTATFLGNVFLSNGRPLVDASVQFVDAEGEILAEDYTDGSGEFTISNLDRFTIQAATSIVITKEGYLTWLDGNVNLPIGQITQRRYQYGRLQITVDTKPRKLRKKLNGTEVTLLNQRDEHGDPPSNEITKKQRKLNFPNVPAGAVQIRAINPNLTGVQATVTVSPGRVTKTKVNLRPRGIF